MSVEGQRIEERGSPPERSYSFTATDAQVAALAGVLVVERLLGFLLGTQELGGHVPAKVVIVAVLFDVAMLVFLVLGFRVAWWLLFIRFAVGAVFAAGAATRGEAPIHGGVLLLDLAGILLLRRIWVPRLWTFV
jgi:hypothetical protein